MKSFVSIALFILCLSTHAQESANAPKHRTVDISGMMKKPDPLPEESKPGITVNLTCKTDSGKEVKSGESGFDSCLQDAQKKNAAASSPKSR